VAVTESWVEAICSKFRSGDERDSEELVCVRRHRTPFEVHFVALHMDLCILGCLLGPVILVKNSCSGCSVLGGRNL
jgi:hypothetical protein